MQNNILLIVIFGLISGLAWGQDLRCKTEFTMGPYKKNAFGKYKRDREGKFNNTIVEGTMKVEMDVNKDHSAFFTYSSHNDGPDRLTTYYKSQLSYQNTIQVTMNFILQGKEMAPQVMLEVTGENSDFIELAEPVFWKMRGEHKIMIEQIYYHCKLQTQK